jgi:hypothetical protein
LKLFLLTIKRKQEKLKLFLLTILDHFSSSLQRRHQNQWWQIETHKYQGAAPFQSPSLWRSCRRLENKVLSIKLFNAKKKQEKLKLFLLTLKKNWNSTKEQHLFNRRALKHKILQRQKKQEKLKLFLLTLKKIELFLLTILDHFNEDIGISDDQLKHINTKELNKVLSSYKYQIRNC